MELTPLDRDLLTLSHSHPPPRQFVAESSICVFLLESSPSPNLLQKLRFAWAKGVSVDAQHPDSHPQAPFCGLVPRYSTAIMTLEALITAKASLPSAKPRDCTDVLVMMETTSTPGATSKVISQFTAPWTILITLPLRIFRALIFMTQDDLSRRVRRQFDSLAETDEDVAQEQST